MLLWGCSGGALRDAPGRLHGPQREHACDNRSLVFCSSAHGVSDVPAAVYGHIMFGRPHLGLVNALPNTVSPQPGLDNRPLGLADVETPWNSSRCGCSGLFVLG